VEQSEELELISLEQEKMIAVSNQAQPPHIYHFLPQT
jgi:hypothetical protein